MKLSPSIEKLARGRLAGLARRTRADVEDLAAAVSKLSPGRRLDVTEEQDQVYRVLDRIEGIGKTYLCKMPCPACRQELVAPFEEGEQYVICGTCHVQWAAEMIYGPLAGSDRPVRYVKKLRFSPRKKER